MAARILRHKPESEQSSFYRWTENLFNRIIAAYGRSLRWVLQYETAALLVAAATLVLTVISVHRDSQGILPGTGHWNYSRRLAGAGIDIVSSDVRQTTGAQQGSARGRCGGEPILIHRRRRSQYNAEQRPVPDQPEAGQRAPISTRLRSSIDFRQTWIRTFPEYTSICSLYRTSR